MIRKEMDGEEDGGCGALHAPKYTKEYQDITNNKY